MLMLMLILSEKVCWYGIMEGASWWYDIAEGTWKAQEGLDDTKSEMKKMTLEEIETNKFRMFESFLNSLVKK